ncbi:MAG: isoprenylcysteine carboxylmethyltransferase family protein [Vicinamibacterales bacterium]
MLSLVFAWLGAAAFAASLVYFLYSYFFSFGVPPPSPADLRNTLVPIGIDVGLFTAFAVHHSLFARTRVKTIVRARTAPALERAFYTWVASLLFVLVCVAWQPVPGVLYTLHGPLGWLGWSVQAAGVLFTFLGARALDVLDLAGVRPVLRSQHPDTAAVSQVTLQTHGVYGLVRHPLYFGWVLLVFGAPHMTATRFTFAAVSTLYVALAIPFEERGLDDTFGADYARYRTEVRWRMLPGLY